ncbi:MAG: 7TM diverse intracellular signaling domain-containing protein [Bacteroidota bacterium]
MKYLFYVLICITSKVAFGQLLISTNENQSYALYPYTQIADVGQSKFSLREFKAKASGLEFKPVMHMNANIGFTANYYWLTFSVQNNTDVKKTYYLETARPITDYVHLYTEFTNGMIKSQESGDAMPFAERDYEHRKTIFKIELPANEKVNFYLNLKSDGEVINLPLKLSTADELIIQTYKEQLVYGIFYGILLLATITYLFFYFALEDKSFLYYFLYVGFVGLLQFALDGFFYQYFGPNAGILSLKAVIIFAALSTLFFVKYTQWFLHVSEHFKSLDKIYKGLFIAILVLFIVCVLAPQIPTLSYTIINAMALLSLVLVIATVVVSIIKKVKVDPFFIAGISCMVLGFTIFILNNFSIIPNSFITENSSKLGTGLEVIFLSLSMSNRIRKLRSEKEMAQSIALKKSEDMNDVKSYFMNNMSHELRTPLNAIMGIADVMLSENIDPKIKENFEIIKYSSQGLLSSVNDILDFSKIEKGELKLDYVEFEPVQLFIQINYSANKQALDKGLLFTYEVDENLPSLLLGDNVRLSQIMNNVISNAIKFTNVGWVNVRVKIIAQYDNEIVLQIAISDSGVGIPKEKIESIYESFSQESITNKRKFGGLGLGLSIVKKLVDLQGGKINITSKTGQGTNCTIELPFTIITQPQMINEHIQKEEPVEDNGVNILLVEDNAINQLIMKKIMNKWENVRYAIANHGEEGLQLLQQDHFDIVLMDLQMPIMDGYEAATAIRVGTAGVSNIDIPIIALTADVMEGTKDRVKQIGMDEYMSKPVDQNMLYQTVMRLIQQKQNKS